MMLIWVLMMMMYLKVYWLKDDEPVDADQDINLIISNEGNLIISQVRLSDVGNYTCVAENVASRRLSEAAHLTVYGIGRPSQSQARFPFKRNRLRWQAANHGCHCFDRAFLLAGACVCCVKMETGLDTDGNV